MKRSSSMSTQKTMTVHSTLKVLDSTRPITGNPRKSRHSIKYQNLQLIKSKVRNLL